MSTKDRIKAVLSDILEVDEDQITDGFGPEDAELWDSLNALRIVTGLEEAFSIHLTMEDIPRMVTFRAIRETVERYLGEGSGSAG